MRGPRRVHKSLWPQRERLFLDMFAGPRAPLSVAFRKLGWAVRSVDILRSASDDVTNQAFLGELLKWIAKVLPSAGFLGPPCSTFSAWMRLCPWSTRTRQNPMGEGKHPKEKIGNACLRAAIQAAEALDAVFAPWSWEQPQTSLMWHVRSLQRLLARGSYTEVTFHWCEWGHEWKKPTTVKGRPAFLPQLERRCQRNHVHRVLEGSTVVDGKRVNWTTLGAEYSKAWCREYAKLQHAELEQRA